jgi:MerR family transcriptional regulator, redox-sensitive transcriptional activator SoxR
MDELLTIGDVAQRSGAATSALRYYEERGLIASQRAPSGHRLYPRWVLRQVAFIVFAQRIGFSLDEIASELAKLPDGRAPGVADWSKLSKTWTNRIDEQIEELKRLRKGLTACIGCGCLSLAKCRFANPNDKMGREGPGPRNWVRRK